MKEWASASLYSGFWHFWRSSQAYAMSGIEMARALAKWQTDCAVRTFIVISWTEKRIITWNLARAAGVLCRISTSRSRNQTFNHFFILFGSSTLRSKALQSVQSKFLDSNLDSRFHITKRAGPFFILALAKPPRIKPVSELQGYNFSVVNVLLVPASSS